MFNSKIVFVIGAGASKEVSMPVGTELAGEIAKKMALDFDSLGDFEGSGDRRLFMNAIQGQRTEIYVNAARILRLGLPLTKSIDEFLDRHNQNDAVVHLGKTAIVRTILEKEANSALYFDRRTRDASINFERLTETWFVKFMYMLKEADPERLFDNVAFVCFNYDRCLEHFLFYAVRALCAASADRAAAAVSRARIFHPYGCIGQIPELAGQGINYGDTSVLDWGGLTKRIKTFSEEIAAPDTLEDMRNEIRNAAVLVFLGFGFHAQNMRLIAEPGTLTWKDVFASALNISRSDVDVVRNRIAELFPSDHRQLSGSFRIENSLTCAGLLKDYAMTLPAI